jgi:hypothetical protein
MKVELKQETYDFIKNLVHEIETQDNRSTRLPILYVIKETIREYGIEEDYGADGFEWVKDSETYTWDEIEDEINKEQQYNFMFDISSIDEDDVKEYGFEKVFYRNVERYSDNFFFTQKAAKEHLRINGHNLTKPQDYVIHAFRNDEIESVIEAMKEIVNKVEEK